MVGILSLLTLTSIIVMAGCSEASAGGGGSSDGYSEENGSSDGYSEEDGSSDGYSVGDTGPAGGVIFYVAADNSAGWQYLEAAPSDIGSSVVTWDSSTPSPTTSGLSFDMGKGLENTTLIIASYNSNNLGNTTFLAKTCNNLSINGYSDWFLPSLYEMKEIYKNKSALSNLSSSGRYWVSSDYGSTEARYIDMSNGSNGLINQASAGRARAVRRF